ncbi:MAG: glycoside hydrolase family 3 C-terminal domain-containing protein [Bacilli bacterium]|nr:glycoside hydrolase family 3 C-terminal domain-containing protein [Bacilli bacterium]
MDIEEVVKQLTLEEKIAIVSGHNFMHTNSISRLGINPINMADGPHGVRKQIGTNDNGISKSEPATCFPPAVTIANSWNVDNAFLIGEAIAKECKFYDIDILLGPGVNIKRNPLCGRNFEYYSEDPFLAGSLGISFVKGVQNNNVGVSLKHFALNNQENYRFMGNSIVDERTMREIYLKPFEMIVKEAKPASIMCAYQQINGTFCSENTWLLNYILRHEWNYDGLVLSDWGAVKNRDISLKAGMDLEMPGDSLYCRWRIMSALENGTLTMSELDRSVSRVLSLMKYKNKGTTDLSINKHYDLAVKIACDGAVLLKNENALPLKKDKLCVVGDLFENMRVQGAGSSMINAAKLVTPKEAFDNHNVPYVYYKGYNSNSNDGDASLLNDVITGVKEYDDILLFIGLTDLLESEGGDRHDMSLPANQIELVNELINNGKNINIVLYGGSPVELPFIDKVKSVLYMGLPGEGGGDATYNLIFGDELPRGRLSETWPIKYSDVPFYDEYSKNINELYKESIYVGYRYYSSFNKNVLFPFGYGLSYSKFEYSNLVLTENENDIEVSFDIKNISNFDGYEVPQIYVKCPGINLFRPSKELVGFAKCHIGPNESKNIKININKENLMYFNPRTKRYEMEDGIYKFLVGDNVESIKVSDEMYINGVKETVYDSSVMDGYKDLNKVDNNVFELLINEQLPNEIEAKELTMETPFIKFKQKFLGKILYKAVSSVATKQRKKGLKLPPGKERDNALKGAMFLQRIFDTNSLRTLSISSGGALPYHIAELMCDMANGHIFKALKHLKNKYQVPQLPDEK